MSDLELQREIIKYKMFNNQNSQQHTTFTEILGLLIFAFMVIAYFNQQLIIQQNSPLNKSTGSNIYYINEPIKKEYKDRYYLN